ncbi:MAG: sensor histidine kinase [Paraglaciecola sp.]|nr:sensor histidine kinase [Paraglaciecola sp.]
MKWFEEMLKNRWFLPSLWQVFLGFYFIKFFMVSLPFEGMWLCLVLLVVYLYAYFWGYYKTDSHRYKAGLLMLACAIITTPFNYGSSIFFQFATLYLANSARVPLALFSIAFVSAIISWLSYQYQLPVTNFLMPALIVSVSLGLFGIFERQRRLNQEQLSQSNNQLKHMAAQAERERIARDLHDVLGHTLTVISLKANLSKQLLKNKDYTNAEQEITDVEKTARETSKLLQRVVSDYKDISLEDEINNLVLLLEQLGLKVEANIHLPNSMSTETATSLSFIVKEAVTNIIKHAQASFCKLSIFYNNDHLNVVIYDNGQSRPPIAYGNGLNGLQSRIAELNGSFTLRQENGMQLTVQLPFEGMQ